MAMIVATLVGGSALLWPLPPTVEIQEVAPPAGRPAVAPRPENAPAPQPRVKGAGRANAAQPSAQPAAPPKQEPPAAVKRFPTQNTALKRLAPPPRPGADVGGTRVVPPQHPQTGWPPRPPAEPRK